MVELTDIMPAGTPPEEEIAQLAGRILKVYGKVEAPTLTREILRMAEILGIPEGEIFGRK
jgi:hypothetical protein